jgi:hypothetical protein
MSAPKDAPQPAWLRPLHRALVYGLTGCAGELLFTACTSLLRTQRVRPHSSPQMLPIYALIQPLFEPVHEAIRGRVPPFGRGVIYGTGFHAVEYVSGRLLRRALGRAPWDYSGARWQLDGLIRFDYFPLWAAAGLVIEQLHDRLTGRPWVMTRRLERLSEPAAASTGRAGARHELHRAARPEHCAARS